MQRAEVMMNTYRVWKGLFIILFLMLPTICLEEADGASSQQNQEQQKNERVVLADPFPVMLDGKVIFSVRTSIYAYGPEGRARVISDRLQRLLLDSTFNPDSMTIVETGLVIDIVAGKHYVTSTTEDDAAAEGKDKKLIAEERLQALQTAMKTALQERSKEHRLRAILHSSLLIFAFLLFAMVLIKTFLRFFAFMDRHIEHHAEHHHVRLINALIGGRLRFVIKVIFRIVGAVILIVAFDMTLYSILGYFPETREARTQMHSFTLSPLSGIGEAILSYLPKLSSLVIIIFIAFLITRIARHFFALAEEGKISLKGFHADWAMPTHRIFRFLVIALALVAAFPYLPGAHSPAFQGVSVFLGLLFSLGSSSVVANIMSGIVLTYTRAFKVGDRVKIGETTGDIIEKTLLVTRIRTIKNVDVAIPNSAVLGGHVINYSAVANDSGLILHTSVTIGYDAPWRTVHALLISAAASTENVLREPKPFVLQTALNDFYVTYELNAYTDRPNEMVVTYSNLHQNIQDSFNKAGVEIMSPHYAQLRDGNTTTIPADYLPKDDTPGGIRLTKTDGETSQ